MNPGHRFWIMMIVMIVVLLLISACGALRKSTVSDSPKSVTEHIKIGTTNRSYELFMPTGANKDKTMPLVLVLHATFGSGREMEKITGFSEIADREHFVVVYPNGIGLFGFLRHWNAGFCCGRAMKKDWNDTGFLLELIQSLTQQLPVDPKRIYLMGLSNGGMLAHRFATEHPEQLAAVTLAAAAVGARWKGKGPMQTCSPPSQPLPVLIIHAQDDEMIPFEGGQSLSRADVEFLGPKDAAEFWCASNGCAPVPTEHIRKAEGKWTRWSKCREDAEVVLFAKDQGGHAWPARPSDPHWAEPDADWAEVAWQFMSRFKKP